MGDERKVQMDDQKKKIKKIIAKLLLSAFVIGLVIFGAYLLFRYFGWTDLSREQIQDFIASKGAWGPTIYVLLSFLQVTFVPIPAALTIIAGNYLFGPGLAFLYSYIGMMFGSAVAFALGKWLGRPFVNWVFGDKESVENYLRKMIGKENVILFFMFFLPFFPDDALCSLAGILPISWFGFMMMQVVTRATSIGGTLLFMSGEVIPYHGWGIVVLMILGVLALIAFIICYRNAEKLQEAFYKLFRRSEKKDQTENKEEL